MAPMRIKIVEIAAKKNFGATTIIRPKRIKASPGMKGKPLGVT
jgi:hypothetical protein